MTAACLKSADGGHARRARRCFSHALAPLRGEGRVRGGAREAVAASARAQCSAATAAARAPCAAVAAVAAGGRCGYSQYTIR